MTDSLSPVELIAEALRQHGWGVQIGYYQSQRLAEAVEAAVRSWPAVTQAQLIGGGVSVAGSDYTIQCSGPAETLTAPGVRFGSAERVVGPWVPVPAQLIGDTE